MKHTRALWGFLSLCVMAFAVGCATPPAGSPAPSPAQQALNLTATSCKNIDSAILATDQAVVGGLLKGNDARNATKGLTVAQGGCVTALGSLQAAAAAASGASK